MGEIVGDGGVRMSVREWRARIRVIIPVGVEIEKELDSL